ncbi:fungal specific transcription factor domain-containing protein [Sarocladium implicatum]|nr:fungal specific transcription factor domain-containing protein [Sarocladium implicatum]
MLFSDGRWRKSNAGPLRELTKAAGQPETSRKPCSLPSVTDGSSLVEQYLNWAHVMGPFLLRREVWALHSRVHENDVNDKTSEAEDLFRIFMIYALAAIIPYRNGSHHQHPNGYYMAALQHLDSRFLARGMRSLEDLLLVCRYGIYENIGTSIWDAVRLSGRLCVELELHAHDGPPGTPPLERQRRRCVFWKFYLLDRYCSSTLDRPFALDDRDVHIGLPANVDDEILESCTEPLESLHSVSSPDDSLIPTETTVFLRNVTLRQVSSHIHTKFSHLREECTAASSKPHLIIGRIYMTLNQLLEDLEKWRISARNIANPTCVYHLQDWSDFLCAREKLYLIRRAVDLVPRKNNVLPRQFATLLLHAALQVIKQYSTLRESSLVTHTRNYFHMMFTAGLSVIYCISSKAKLSSKDLSASTQGLRVCEKTLSDMAAKLAHSNPYVTVYAALHRDVSHKIQRALIDTMASSRQSSPTRLPNDPRNRHTDTSIAHGVPSAASGPPPNLPPTDDVQLHSAQQYAPLDEPFGDLYFAGSQPMAAQVGEPVGLSAEYNTDTMFAVSSNELNDLNTLGDDLLHWARTDDSTLRTIDTTLLDDIYGDLDLSGPALNAFFGGF